MRQRRLGNISLAPKKNWGSKVLESGLFFVLGFLASTMLALLLAPPIWRRAVALTQKRIEDSVPLTLNEIQADKDQLRAEYAMLTRKLEINLENVKSKAADQLVELNKRRDQVLDLETDVQERDNRIDALERQGKELRASIEGLELRLAQTTSTLTSTKQQLQEKIDAYTEMDVRYREMAEDVDSQKIEIISRETKLDNMESQTAKTRRDLKEAVAERDKLRSELRVLSGNMDQEKKRYEKLREKNVDLQAQSADLEGRLERREADLTRLRESANGDSKTVVSPVLKKLEEKNHDLKEEIKTLQARLDGRPEDVGSAQSSDTNALFREKISELAAKVTAATAADEGVDSPINAVLEKASAPRSKVSEADRAADQIMSLAERIKSMQLNDQDA